MGILLMRTTKLAVLRQVERITAVLARGLVQGEHVFHRHECLNIVDGVEHEAPTGSEGPDSFANFLTNFLR
jgi:hypothetical protein